MRAHLGHQIPVALVNERAVKFRAFFRKLEHHARKVCILLEFFNRFRGLFFGFIIGKQGLEDIPQKPAFVPEAVVGPDALERNIDISVNQADRYVLRLGIFGRPDELGPRFYAEHRPDSPLVSGNHEIREEIEEFPLFDDLEDIEFFPAVFIIKAVVSLLVELDAHDIWRDFIDELSNFLAALLADMRGADNMERAAFVLDDRHMSLSVTRCFAIGGFIGSFIVRAIRSFIGGFIIRVLSDFIVRLIGGVILSLFKLCGAIVLGFFRAFKRII